MFSISASSFRVEDFSVENFDPSKPQSTKEARAIQSFVNLYNSGLTLENVGSNWSQMFIGTSRSYFEIFKKLVNFTEEETAIIDEMIGA